MKANVWTWALFAAGLTGSLAAQSVQPPLQGGLAPNPATVAAQQQAAPAAAQPAAPAQVPLSATPIGALVAPQGPPPPGAAVPVANAVPVSTAVPSAVQAANPMTQVPSNNPAYQIAPPASDAAPPTYAQQLVAAQQQNPNNRAPVQGNPYAGGAGQATVPPSQVPPQELPPLPTPESEMPNVVRDTLGVTPEQIRDLHRAVDVRQKASAAWVNPPKSVTSSLTVSLSPGAVPPVIRPFYGATTSFLVVDSTGQPWPVENARNGNGGLFAIDRLDGPQGSVFTIDTLQPYGQSNLILKLAGVPTPVVINLIAGQKVQDARVEVRVAGRGPNAQRPVSSGGNLPPGTDARLLPVLDGVAPEGASPLQVMGADGVKGWLLPNGHMLIRAPFKLLSPVIAATSSADGTTVYELPATPKLLGMADGAYVHLTIAGW
jgi:intracellular multiplication protein IcmK